MRIKRFIAYFHMNVIRDCDIALRRIRTFMNLAGDGKGIWIRILYWTNKAHMLRIVCL